MAAPATLHRHSFADYLALEDASNTKHEFLNGEIYGMAGGTPEYRRIPSLAAVVLVSHRGPAIEVWERGPDSAWRRREFGPGQAAEIQALPARLLVDEIYLGSEP
jgi:Uma2 family endonuclease